MKDYNSVETAIKVLGWSYEQTAEEAGLATNTVYAISKMKIKNPSLKIARALSRALGVSIDLLFPDPERNKNDKAA